MAVRHWYFRIWPVPNPVACATYAIIDFHLIIPVQSKVFFLHAILEENIILYTYGYMLLGIAQLILQSTHSMQSSRHYALPYFAVNGRCASVGRLTARFSFVHRQRAGLFRMAKCRVNTFKARWSAKRDEAVVMMMMMICWMSNEMFLCCLGVRAPPCWGGGGVCCASCKNVSKIPNKVTVTLVKNLPF